MRDEFPSRIKRQLAQRVGMRCSNPECRRPTCGPTEDAEGSINIGVAAHITAAALGGSRFDANMSNRQRASIENGIWLCQTCGKLVDSDEGRFSVDILHDWKRRAENQASLAIAAGTVYRTIASNEIQTGHTISHQIAISALSEEFGCTIQTDILIPTDDGELYLDGAVVKDEELVAIDIYECHDNGIPYFQIEYMIELGTKLEFPRFKGFILFIAVVSDQDLEVDKEVHRRLIDLAADAPFEMYIRMYRLNPLRARYSI